MAGLYFGLGNNLKHSEYLAIWDAALAAPHGLEVQTDDWKLMQQHLYRARAAEPTDKYDNLAISAGAIENTLWICFSNKRRSGGYGPA